MLIWITHTEQSIDKVGNNNQENDYQSMDNKRLLVIIWVRKREYRRHYFIAGCLLRLRSRRIMEYAAWDFTFGEILCINFLLGLCEFFASFLLVFFFRSFLHDLCWSSAFFWVSGGLCEYQSLIQEAMPTIVEKPSTWDIESYQILQRSWKIWLGALQWWSAKVNWYLYFVCALWRPFVDFGRHFWPHWILKRSPTRQFLKQF